MAILDQAAQDCILVAVDASAASLLALELAADLAAALRTRLAGLYVEEEHLLHAAGLPFVREVRSQSGQLAPFTGDDLQRYWRAVAAEARSALTRAAQARQIAFTFQVVRGRAAQAMSLAARSARLTGLGSGTWNAQGLILAADSRFAHPAAVERLLTEGGCALLLARKMSAE